MPRHVVAFCALVAGCASAVGVGASDDARAGDAGDAGGAGDAGDAGVGPASDVVVPVDAGPRRQGDLRFDGLYECEPMPTDMFDRDYLRFYADGTTVNVASSIGRTGLDTVLVRDSRERAVAQGTYVLTGARFTYTTRAGNGDVIDGDGDVAPDAITVRSTNHNTNRTSNERCAFVPMRFADDP